jgi:polyisoprenoid-binding protein YceI
MRASLRPTFRSPNGATLRAALVAALAAAASGAATPVAAQGCAGDACARPAVREFRLDAAHSAVAFAIGFLGHPVRGRFDDVRGTIVYAPGAPEASSVTVAIRTASLATGSAHRDEHLRSADFFDAATHPVILFRSRRVRPAAGGGFVVTGPLTMHGVTREVSIPFRETRPPYAEPHGSTLVFFAGGVRLAREDFGILGGSAHNDWFDAVRSATMADSVDVTLEVAGWDTDYARSARWRAPLARLARDGVGPTVARLRALRAQHPDTLRGAEWELDQLGRAMLERGPPADAVELFRLNLELFPKSAAAHTAMARWYELAGDRGHAARAVERALGLDPYETRALELERRLGRVP